MAPTVDDVHRALIHRAESKPGWARDMEMLREMWRPLKTTAQAVENRLDVLFQEGKLVRFLCHPSGTIHFRDAPGTRSFVSLVYKGTDAPHAGPLTLDRRQAPKGALWTGDKLHWFFMEKTDFETTLARLKAEASAAAEQARSEASGREAELHDFLRARDADALDVLDRLNGIAGVDSRARLHKGGKEGEERQVTLTVMADESSATFELLAILRRGMVDEASRANGLAAARQFPAVDMDDPDVDAMTKRVLESLVPDAEARDAVWRLLRAAARA
jgi:hypothetical protein